MSIDLNCDLGEGESPRRTEALLRRVTSCNIACGVHAGSVETMALCIKHAKRFGVRIGAHPGAPGAFGRGEVLWSVAEFSRQVVEQASALLKQVRQSGATLHHVKLHGSLYHRTEQDPSFAESYLKAMASMFPGVIVYGLAGGRVATEARRYGIVVWEEAFLDRGYQANGALIPRRQPGADFSGAAALRRRLDEVIRQGGLILPGGSVIHAQTYCLHGDHQESLRNATLAARKWANVLGREASRTVLGGPPQP